MSAPPPAPPLPLALSSAQTIAQAYGALKLDGPDAPELLSELIHHHAALVRELRRPNPEPTADERTLLSLMLDALVAIPCVESTADLACGMLETAFRYFYSLQVHADETSPVVSLRDPVRLVRHAKHLQSLRSLHLTTTYNITRANRATSAIQAPESPLTATVANSFLRLASGFSTLHKPLPALEQLSGALFPKLWTFIMQALPRTPVPVLKLALSIAPLQTIIKPPELVPAVAAAFARACESASAPAIAAAADALAALVSKDDPEVIELFVRFGSMGFLLLPTERDVNSSHTRFPNVVGRFLAHLTPAPGLTLHHVVRAGDSDAITTTLRPDRPLQFSFYARTTPAPGYIPVSTRSSSIRVDHPDDRTRGRGDFTMYVPMDRATATSARPTVESLRPEHALQAVRALLAEATATEPSDALMQGLRSALKLLLLLWRDLELPCDCDEIVHTLDQVSQYLFAAVRSVKVVCTRTPLHGLPSNLTSNSFRCGATRRCENGEQCSSCSLMQVPEVAIFMAMEPLADLCMHALLKHASPGLFRATARCYAVLEEDPEHDMATVCASLRRMALPETPTLLASMFTEALLDQLTKKTNSGPSGYVLRSNFHVGARVIRSDHWHYDNQDGGPGNHGTIIARDSENWVRVRWAVNNSDNVYEIENESNSTLFFADTRPDWFIVRHLGQIVRLTTASGQPQDGDNFESLVPMVISATQPAFLSVLKRDVRDTLTAIDEALTTLRLCWQAVRTPETTGETTPLPTAVVDLCEQKLVDVLVSCGVKDQILTSVRELALGWAATKDASNLPSDHRAFKVSLTQDNTDPLCRRIHSWLRAQWEHGAAEAARVMCSSHKDDLSGVLALLCEFIEAFRPGKSSTSHELKNMTLAVWSARFKGRDTHEFIIDDVAHFGMLALRALASCWPDGGFDLLSRKMSEAGTDSSDLRTFFEVRRPQIHGGDDVARLIGIEFAKVIFSRTSNVPNARIATMVQEMMARLLKLACDAQEPVNVRSIISDVPWGRVVVAISEGDGLEQAVGKVVIDTLPEDLFASSFAPLAHRTLAFLQANLQSFLPAFSRAVELGVAPDPKAAQSREVLDFLQAASSLQRVCIPSLLDRFFALFGDVVRSQLLHAVLGMDLTEGLHQLTIAVEVLGLLSWNSMALKQSSARLVRLFVEGDEFRGWLPRALAPELEVFSATRQNASLASIGLLLRSTVNWERGFGCPLSLSPVVTETLKKLLSDDVGRLVVNSQHNASHIVEGLCALRECWLACVDDGFGANYLRCQYLPLSDELDEPDNGKATHWFRAVTSLCVRAQESPESAVVGELSSNVFFQVADETNVEGSTVWRCKLGWVGPLLGVAEPRGSEKTPAQTATPVRASATSPRRQPAAAGAEWACLSCTFANRHGASVCEACGTARSQAWACMVCTFENQDSSRFSCEMCGTHRPPTTADTEDAEEAQPRGKCTNAECPTREFSACGAYIPIRDENKCSFCGCSAENHKLELAERDLFMRRAARQCYPTGLEVLRPLRVTLMQRLIDGAQSPADTSTHQGLVGLLAIFLTEQLDALNRAVSLEALRATLQRAGTLAAMLSPMTRRSLQTLLLEGTTTRLLRGRSRCVEAEHIFASVFGPVFGQMFVTQIKAMLDESSWSAILSRQFALATGPSQFDFGAVVVSRHNWAFASIFEVSWTPPAQLRQCLADFSAYQHAGGQLELRFPEPTRNVRIHVHFVAAARIEDHTTCLGCKTVLGHLPSCVVHTVQGAVQLGVSNALPVALLGQFLLAGLGVSTQTPIQLFQGGRFLLDGSESLSKLPADPIVAVVAHRAVKVPARILPDALKPTSINAPQFYSRHAATTLTWLPRGQGELLWADKKATLSVSTVQMCVLLAFNEADTLSYGQLLAKTGLADSILEAELLALCTAPHDVLTAARRRRREASFSDSDQFSINAAFAGTGSVFVRSTAFAVARQDVTRSAVSLHGNCIDRLDATIMRLLKHNMAAVGVSKLTADVAVECRSQFIVAPEHVSERLRRLAADGLVHLEGDKASFVPDTAVEAGPAPMAVDGALSRSVSLDNRGQPEGLLRLDSVTDDAPGIMRVQSVDLAAAAKYELSVLLPTFTLDVASDLAVLGLSSPGPVFCTRDAMLRGLYSTIERLSDCLSISKSNALFYLSVREVRWDMRAAIDYHYSKPRPKCEQNAHCGFSVAYSCEEHPLEETFPVCGHSFHRVCLHDYLVEHCFGNFSGSAVRGETAIAGTTCPMPDETSQGKPACKSFIPWLELLDSDFFGANKDEARTRFEDDILTQWASESPLLQACPGGCGMYAAVSAPPEQSVTIAQCTRCKTSFCFKCKGKWFEDHRPALCDHMTRWGDSIFSGESATQSADADATLLNQIYMFNNTVRCPRCKVRVQKSSGCQHLTCGASSYRGTDWRGRGCGLDFCEVCETPLAESNCESSTCRRPEQRARLEEERNRNRGAREQFQKVYMPRAQRETLRAAVVDAQAKVDGADQLEALAEMYIECMLARAHSIVTATLEPGVGLDEQTKRIAIKNLEDIIAQLQKMLVVYLPLRHLGPPQRGSVTMHEHELVQKTRQVSCSKCARDAPTGFSCPEDDGFEICVACFFDHFQPPRDPVRGELADRARTVLQTFFRAFA